VIETVELETSEAIIDEYTQKPPKKRDEAVFYNVLDLAPSATSSDILNAYQELKRTYQAEGMEHFDLRFQNLNLAFRILYDKKSRTAYDYALNSGQEDEFVAQLISDLPIVPQPKQPKRGFGLRKKRSQEYTPQYGNSAGSDSHLNDYSNMYKKPLTIWDFYPGFRWTVRLVILGAIILTSVTMGLNNNNSVSPTRIRSSRTPINTRIPSTGTAIALARTTTLSPFTATPAEPTQTRTPRPTATATPSDTDFGDRFFERGNYLMAVNFYNNVLDVASLPSVHYRRGLAYAILYETYFGDPESPSDPQEYLNNALNDFTRAIELSPNFAAPYLERGKLYLLRSEDERNDQYTINALEDFLVFSELIDDPNANFDYIDDPLNTLEEIIDSISP